MTPPHSRLPALLKVRGVPQQGSQLPVSSPPPLSLQPHRLGHSQPTCSPAPTAERLLPGKRQLSSAQSPRHYSAQSHTGHPGKHQDILNQSVTAFTRCCDGSARRTVKHSPEPCTSTHSTNGSWTMVLRHQPPPSPVLCSCSVACISQHLVRKPQPKHKLC